MGCDTQPVCIRSDLEYRCRCQIRSCTPTSRPRWVSDSSMVKPISLHKYTASHLACPFPTCPFFSSVLV